MIRKLIQITYTFACPRLRCFACSEIDNIHGFIGIVISNTIKCRQKVQILSDVNTHTLFFLQLEKGIGFISEMPETHINGRLYCVSKT